MGMRHDDKRGDVIRLKHVLLNRRLGFVNLLVLTA
jgi:hypothetical protein